MNFCVIAATLSLGFNVALASTASDIAATESQRAPDNAAGSGKLRRGGGATTTNLQGTRLTASHKRMRSA